MGAKEGDGMQTIQDAKILIVDDSRELRNLLKEELGSAGYHRLKSADSVKSARQAIGEELPELVILDINLPDGDGFSLFREIRAHSDVPILFLSARDADSDRLFGLGLGADDYMAKPFLMQELLLRVSGILRRVYRGQLQKECVLPLGDRTVDFGDATVTTPVGTVSLTATERTILQKLLDNHVHQVCTSCGKVTIVPAQMEDIQLLDVKLKRFRPEAFAMYIYGICSKCQAKLTRQKRTSDKKQNKKNTKQ